MAIYHLSAQVIGRSSGRSATAAAAYRAAIQITDVRTGLLHDYSRKGGVAHAEIIAPAGVPAWVQDRTELWNRVEAAEKRKDAQLAREVNIALPVELSKEQQIDILRSFVREQYVGKGMIADLTVHLGDRNNPHAHVMLTTREITSAGFGNKNREWNQKELLIEQRAAWEEHANHALERAGFDSRIDHRTLEAQGIDRRPQVHLGPNVIKMERRGFTTERGEINRGIRRDQVEMEKVVRERDRASIELHDLKKEKTYQQLKSEIWKLQEERRGIWQKLENAPDGVAFDPEKKYQPEIEQALKEAKACRETAEEFKRSPASLVKMAMSKPGLGWVGSILGDMKRKDVLRELRDRAEILEERAKKLDLEKRVALQAKEERARWVTENSELLKREAYLDRRIQGKHKALSSLQKDREILKRAEISYGQETHRGTLEKQVTFAGKSYAAIKEEGGRRYILVPWKKELRELRGHNVAISKTKVEDLGLPGKERHL
jgi:hypothetical protein